MTLRDVLVRVIAAADALEVGADEEARQVLYDLENDLSAAAGGAREYRCDCGQAFAWPGLLEAHAIDCRAAWAWEAA